MTSFWLICHVIHLNNYCHFYIALQIVVSLIINLYAKFMWWKWRFYLGCCRRLSGDHPNVSNVGFLFLFFFLTFDIFVAEYLGLKDEREGWLCAKNMWIGWWYYLFSQQFFKWHHCSRGSWSYCDCLRSSQVVVLWRMN